MQKMQEHFSALHRLKRLLLVLYLLHNPQGRGECRFCMEQKSVHAVVRVFVVKNFSACVNLIWKRVAMDIPQPFITAIHARKFGGDLIEPVEFRKTAFVAGAVPLVHRPV